MDSTNHSVEVKLPLENQNPNAFISATSKSDAWEHMFWCGAVSENKLWLSSEAHVSNNNFDHESFNETRKHLKLRWNTEHSTFIPLYVLHLPREQSCGTAGSGVRTSRTERSSARGEGRQPAQRTLVADRPSGFNTLNGWQQFVDQQHSTFLVFTWHRHRCELVLIVWAFVTRTRTGPT